MRLAGLKLSIGDNLHIHILPGVGLSITHFFLRFVGLEFDLPQLDGFEELEAKVWCVSKKGQWIHSLMESPLIGVLEKQHALKSPAWSCKATEGLACPSDCHKTAKIMSDENVLYTTYHPCFIKFGIWSQTFQQSRS